MKFEHIAVGDKVVVASHKGTHILTVTKVTPTRFEAGATTYTKKDGSHVGGSAWSSRSAIRLATPEDTARTAHITHCSKLLTRLQAVTRQQLIDASPDTLSAIEGILSELS